MKVVHYLNQFFGGIGGEDSANEPARLVEGAVGPGRALDAALGDAGSVTATIICGDNYFVENEDEARVFVKNAIDEHKPDVIVTGPAFDSGRYGLACGLVSQIARASGVPSISAMEPDNSGVAVYRREMICYPTGSNVADMPNILQQLAGLASRLGAGETLGSAHDEGYIPRGIRTDMEHEKPGSTRAVDMVLARIAGRPFDSEIVIRDYDHVTPPPPLESLAGIKVAIVTSGGLVPKGNPDKLAAARADSYFHYSIEGMTELKVGDWESIHGGYGHRWVNEKDPNYVVPLRSLRKLESQGAIGSIYGSYISTVGNQTSIGNARQFGREIVEEFEEAGVGAVIMVPT
jgi:glycine reductase